jgi:hypothetical protein
MAFLTELIRFLIVRRKFWLTPIIIAMFLFGGVVVLAGNSAVAPFIYALF